MVELLTTKFADEARYSGMHNAAASTWVASFKQIRKDADAAIGLSLIGHIESKAIPRWMLPRDGSDQRTMRALGLLLLPKDYAYLAKCLVPIRTQVDMTMEDHIAMLKRHSRQFTKRSRPSLPLTQTPVSVIPRKPSVQAWHYIRCAYLAY